MRCPIRALTHFLLDNTAQHCVDSSQAHDREPFGTLVSDLTAMIGGTSSDYWKLGVAKVMTVQLDVGKVALGAFLVPWWNRGAFAKALALPLVLLVALTVSWYYASGYLPQLSHWVLYLVYGALFVLFAVTCHRLVLLDPQVVASRIAPRWSRRETHFFLWMIGVWLIFAAVTFALTTALLNVWLPWVSEPNSTLFGWTVFLAKLPAFYLFARLCLVFPATAVDRNVDLKWAWSRSANNGWRLVLLVAVLPWVISHAVGLLYRGNASVVEIILLQFVACAFFAVEVAAISLSYRELTKDERP